MAVLVASTGCGGQTTSAAGNGDGRDASAGGASGPGSGGSASNMGGVGGALPTSGGSGGASGGASASRCNDGRSGRVECCAADAAPGGPCGAGLTTCSRGGCHAGITSYLYCGGGTWTAGKAEYPCTEGPDGAPTACDKLRDEWNAFVASHATCTVDADCAVFLAKPPSSSTCEGEPGLNRVLAKQVIGEAQPFAARNVALACGGDLADWPYAPPGWSDFSVDGRELENPRCESGTCVADTPVCNDPISSPATCNNFDEATCPLDRCQLLPLCNGTASCIDLFKGPPPPCGAEGYYGGAVACCSGLVKRCGLSADGACLKEGDPANVRKSLCIPCGNGVCDPSEDACSCPEDCH